MKLIFAALIMSLLLSCSDYEFTLNDQPLQLRTPVSVVFTVPDPSLSRCVTETLNTQNATRIDDLRILDCSFAGIKSLEGLEQFQGLVRLKLSGNELYDIRPLLSLGGLTIAELSENSNIPCQQLRVLESFIGSGLTHSRECEI
jgi:Leucine-rich repeat (LRR) protein